MSGISLENRLAVHELIASYSYPVDNYRGEDWADLFLEDGRLLGPDIHLQGRDAFVRKAQDLQAGSTEYRHCISNVVVESESTDERAQARAYGAVSDWATRPAVLSIFVEYRFELHNTAQGWKIAEMRVHMPYAD
ncbi:nuclear transport factor 2 family protein [Mangrovimicrobium sediminis]|uniref:Nuclear transport factor 2 family protein n=1 Tax=Mangrovimicrobium sediminis TaxID=2562682 RepID=A0A4Z0LW44_9GAMM|nr:nuclear transport factor 2 family protein [Haliea sp. SAOS-164]TGD71295.1 nuclear transport factor 2 family protein [Haliea sp. SAOS-164]